MTDIVPYTFDPEHCAVDYPSSTDSEEDIRDIRLETAWPVMYHTA